MNGESRELNVDSKGVPAKPVGSIEDLRRLFEAAIEVPLDQRSEFLRSRCSDDRVVREVESLLEHDSAAGDDYLIPASQPSKLE